MHDLSIIIVNWNTRHVVRGCLESVLATLGTLKAEIIVVDNASADGSADMIARDFPQVRLIANEDNHGFAAANNQGMRLARGRYILLLNPDTVVLDDVLERTVAYADENPDAGVVGCQVLEGPDTVQRTCFRFPSPLSVLLWVSGVIALFPRWGLARWATYGTWQRDYECDVDVVSGMFMLVRRQAIDEVGPMDEGYFIYAEEADWCYRFRKAGWRRVFAPVGRILHLDGGGKSTEQAGVKMYVEMQKGLLRFHRLHLHPVRWAASKFLFATSMVVRMLLWTALSVVGAGEASAHKARQAAAAARFHWLGWRGPMARPIESAMTPGRKKILAVASGGGHWVQLQRLRPAFAGEHVIYVTVDKAYRADIGTAPLYVVNDATRWSKWSLVKLALRIAWIIMKERPDIVVTTGAAPGYFAVMFGKLSGARTVWIDSMANVDQLSMAGRKAGRWADRWLTQWPALAVPGGPTYEGAVL